MRGRRISTLFAYGRQIYSPSRAGYFPAWLSVTHGRRETPVRALLAGSALGLGVALAIHLTPQSSPVGAVLAYILQIVSFLVLRVRFRDMQRPYRSPAGIAGAVAAAVVALATLIVLFGNKNYNRGVIAAAIWFLLGIAYYVFYARHWLVLAPEELAAIAHRREETPEA